MMQNLNVALTVMSDGDRTVAEALLITDYAYDISVSGVGSSARERGDKNRQNIGDDLAVARALHSLAAHLERRANGNVKHAEDVKFHRAQIALRKLNDEQNTPPPQYTLSRAFGETRPASTSIEDLPDRF